MNLFLEVWMQGAYKYYGGGEGMFGGEPRWNTALSETIITIAEAGLNGNCGDGGE